MSLKSILILGSGGREHAWAFFFAKQNDIRNVFVVPGNDGMEITPKVSIFKNMSHEAAELAEFCQNRNVDLVIVGSELPLSLGFVDDFQKISQVPVLGPTKAAALLETSKSFAKEFMTEFSIPTAKFQKFKKDELKNKTKSELLQIISEFGNEIPVIKASGLCAGKGVIVPSGQDDFFQGLNEFIHKDVSDFDASEIILEERMKGPEVSLFYLCQGQIYVEIGSACDYKRWGDENEGPNTGGMGAHLPSENLLTSEDKKFINEKIVAQTLKGMKQRGSPYNGILFVGLMLTASGPKVIEFNCRMGDPETQVLMPLMPQEFGEALLLASTQKLQEWISKYGQKIKLAEKKAVHVVLTHPHYAGQNKTSTFSKNLKITLPSALLDLGSHDSQNIFLFSCAMEKRNEGFVTSGGRIVGVTALGVDLEEARTLAYEVIREIYFEGRHYRTDIAKKVEG